MKVDSFESVSKISRQSFDNDNKRMKEVDQSIKSQPESLQEINEYSQEELEDDVRESVKDINDIVQKVKEDLSFEVHDETDRMMVKVIDRRTKEVIKELPPEEMLDLSARIHEMVGLLIDEKV
ncbi:flagellar protein FlaG [Halanaerobium saccharolyticum]|uniref:Flagellar protein FlaG n=1 Tax=Halanaerobium saccharolyticum TaxID=43595 RepID=A0A4V3G5Y3_9FIRM|nr:flagellar protein FlaG [Halanaerobium saccharolyticum]RAK08593.1 flagellar protein FlaG [Halanaerobium saccharolyticum]TDW07264.1 flagellar protein FlaG [Halanaerobium saccharolyticum]TDX60145.1 flagellar protein FlaG [Halanaerobium saccharolyticum]